MNALEKLISELEQHSVVYQKINITVSHASVGWHIEHSLMVISAIVGALEKSNPTEYKWKFNKWRMIVMGLKVIPRGRGKAPKNVIPEGEITLETLKQTFEKTRQTIQTIESLQSNNYFKHPYFGDLNLKPTTRFLALHTKHHLKIIKDIIKTL